MALREAQLDRRSYVTLEQLYLNRAKHEHEIFYDGLLRAVRNEHTQVFITEKGLMYQIRRLEAGDIKDITPPEMKLTDDYELAISHDGVGLIDIGKRSGNGEVEVKSSVWVNRSNPNVSIGIEDPNSRNSVVFRVICWIPDN